jgi:DNA-binding protein HU-beta
LAFRVARQKVGWYKVGNRGARNLRATAANRTEAGERHETGHRTFAPYSAQGVIKQMNKAEFTEAVADGAELTKADAGRAVDAMVAAITKALKKGDTVTLVGFGTFSVRKRGARTGRNPRTGDTIKIKASKNPAFKAGKALKDAVN